MHIKIGRGMTGGVVAAIVVFTVASTDVSARAQQDVAIGQQVYAEHRCALCHAIDGEGNQKGPLDGVGSRVSADDIEQWMVAPKEMTAKTGATRRPFMPAYPGLSRDELEALVAYMLSLTQPSASEHDR